jgi:hypothetical protein
MLDQGLEYLRDISQQHYGDDLVFNETKESKE